MDVLIRPMKLEDISQVHEIDVQSFSLPWPERSFRYELTENQTSRLWVAEIGDPGDARIVAMMVLWLILDEAHIGTIAVHSDYRRMGIGRKLLAHALLHAVDEGVASVFLEVRRSNHTAQSLYAQFGFTLDGIRPRYYQDTGEDALLLSLSGLQEASTRAHLLKILLSQSGEQALMGG